MTWQTMLAIVLVALQAGVLALVSQYPVDSIPHWIVVTSAVLGALAASFRAMGFVGTVPPAKKEGE